MANDALFDHLARLSIPDWMIDARRRIEIATREDGYVRGNRITDTVPVESMPALTAESVGIEGFTETELASFLANIPTNYAPASATYLTQTPNSTLSAEQALSSLTSGLVRVTTGTGVLSTATANTDYPAVANPIFTGKIAVTGSAPSIIAGVAAGTGASVAISGTDRAGRLTVVAGTAPGTGTLATVTFSSAYASTSYVIILRAATATAVGRETTVFPDYTARTTTTFTLNITGTALTATSTYSWFYLIERYA